MPFFPSVLPSVSFYCCNPWTSLCHVHHFDWGGGACKCIYLHFIASHFLHRIAVVRGYPRGVRGYPRGVRG